MTSTTTNLLAVPQNSTYVIAVSLSQLNENVVRWIFLKKRQSIMNCLVYTKSIDLAPTYIENVCKIFMKKE